ncbi:hypothetical protein [Thioflexithrix psekupsensis]|uniref:Uncharacterized protein n=1 Tax=Thioflexithrix psekupsensis TaxID=1570016 RepID=A0A251X7A6_9GAMM|nr:hypothetical protein [Thioflexithrix psekupsensis]OUD13069.1 hypothetical protein TPSD3_10485 [Thioflexithrix psekupsensis]
MRFVTHHLHIEVDDYPDCDGDFTEYYVFQLNNAVKVTMRLVTHHLHMQVGDYPDCDADFREDRYERILEEISLRLSGKHLSESKQEEIEFLLKQGCDPETIISHFESYD